jgi:photosystem II stability/assembly factor-like uncharacterized protein
MAFLSRVTFADASHGWAVGYDSDAKKAVILATTDGGAVWTQQSPRTRHDLLSVAFPDASHGWAVGDQGTIVATTDGGALWRKQSSGTKVELSGIAFPDTSHGWAVGTSYNNNYDATGDVILVTSDGGAHWRKQRPGMKADLSAVAFPNATHGWAVGGSNRGSVILATTDGGAHWRRQGPGSRTDGAVLCDVSFADASHGWTVGVRLDLNSATLTAAGVVLATSNGGATWTEQNAGTSNPLLGVAFADVSHGWAVGWGGTILATTTGGEARAAARHR